MADQSEMLFANEEKIFDFQLIIMNPFIYERLKKETIEVSASLKASFL